MTDKLTILDKMWPLIIVLEYFKGLVGQEYKPWDLLFGKANRSNSISLAVTGLNMKELAGDFVFLRKSRWSPEAGILLDNFSPTDAKCSFSIIISNSLWIVINLINYHY